MRVLAIADSDSYLKWAMALLDAAPADWAVRHLVLENVIAPSAAQIAAARPAGSRAPVDRISAVRLGRRVRALAPDVLLVACTGPGVAAVMELLALTDERPVLVTGLPGISFPPNDLAVEFRRGFDVMVLHSRRERAVYAEVSARLGGPEMVLATLPFLTGIAPVARGREVVFAAQSLVPAEADQRRAILHSLAALPKDLVPVVKIRALAGERQAHNEELPYAELWAEMAQPRDIEFRAGSMVEALAEASGFVTVSSTGVLEAVAAGVPSLVLDEFGVSGELINEVFTDSGLLGGLDRLRSADFRMPRAEWLADNYFHAASDNNWVERVTELVSVRRRGDLTGYTGKPLGTRPERLRRLLRVLPPAWFWTAVERLRTRIGRSR